MNLQTAAEGILETHVTWEEVEKNLQEALNTTARLGKNKSVVHVGEGNVRICFSYLVFGSYFPMIKPSKD